jgi:hypothetical protein
MMALLVDETRSLLDGRRFSAAECSGVSQNLRRLPENQNVCLA